MPLDSQQEETNPRYEGAILIDDTVEGLTSKLTVKGMIVQPGESQKNGKLLTIRPSGPEGDFQSVVLLVSEDTGRMYARTSAMKGALDDLLLN